MKQQVLDSSYSGILSQITLGFLSQFCASLPFFLNFYWSIVASRGMDKEDVVHIYNGILLSHKKEQNWVICRDVDGPTDCHTE